MFIIIISLSTYDHGAQFITPLPEQDDLLQWSS